MIRKLICLMFLLANIGFSYSADSVEEVVRLVVADQMKEAEDSKKELLLLFKKVCDLNLHHFKVAENLERSHPGLDLAPYKLSLKNSYRRDGCEAFFR